MFISQEKKKSNIAEYLIYMFQVEDIIRSMNFNIEEIEKHVISRYQLTYNDRRDMREWYNSLANIMKDKKLQYKGHSPLLTTIMDELNDLHIRALSDPDEKIYQSLYQKARPGIMELKEKAGNTGKHEIETCLEGLYGLLLLRLSKKQINPETEKAFGLISKMLAHLSAKYKMVMEGEAEL